MRSPRQAAGLLAALAFGLASACERATGRGESDAVLKARIEETAVAAQRALADAFAVEGRTYDPATVAVVVGDVMIACGATQDLIGFYCATDRTVYVELSYYRDVRRRHGERGERAHAYVVAHELGHHAQELLGLDTGLELQADCLAGVWAHATRRAGFGTATEVAYTLDALGGGEASAHATSSSAPSDGGRHGTSAQRVDAFLRGRTGGTVAACRGEFAPP